MSQPNRGGSDALDVLADTANNELRRSTSGGGNDSGSDSNREGTSPQTRPSLAKKDGLRKGKWLVSRNLLLFSVRVDCYSCVMCSHTAVTYIMLFIHRRRRKNTHQESSI